MEILWGQPTVRISFESKDLKLRLEGDSPPIQYGEQHPQTQKE